MARYPGAAYKPLGTQSEPKMAAHDIVCLHTMVGSLYGTDAYFKQQGYSGPESHFGVGGKWGADMDGRNLNGDVWQWQDTAYQADANLDGNPRVISIETADNAPTSASSIQAWTPEQVESIAQVVAWCCETYDIPANLIPDTKPGRRGIGYHRQGCDPWRVSGGELWSEAYGKECPGPTRISQITSQIIPRVRAILDGGDAPVAAVERTSVFIFAWNSGTPYLLCPEGKRKLSPANKDILKQELTAAGAPWWDLGEVTGAFLSEFPTLIEDGTIGGSSHTNTLNAAMGVADLQARVAVLEDKIDQILANTTPLPPSA